MSQVQLNVIHSRHNSESIRIRFELPLKNDRLYGETLTVFLGLGIPDPQRESFSILPDSKYFRESNKPVSPTMRKLVREAVESKLKELS